MARPVEMDMRQVTQTFKELDQIGTLSDNEAG